MDTRYHVTLADKLVFVVSACMVGLSYYHFWESGPAQHAVVRDHQQHAHYIDLQQDGIHTVNGMLGTSTLEVQDRQLRFTDSPCSNKLCIQSGWHRQSGDIAACLPNRISVQLARNGEPREYDAINF